MHILDTAITYVVFIQRCGSSLELKLPSPQIVVQNNFQLLFLVIALRWNPIFTGNPLDQKKCLFYMSGLGISCPSIVQKGEKIGITRFDHRVTES